MDIVFVNAAIRTLDEENPTAHALAVSDGRLVAVGSDADILALRERENPHAPLIDLGGKTVLPGFIDSHTHFFTGGYSLRDVDLRGCSTPDEFVRRIAQRSGTLSPGSWLRGGGWDHELWAASPLPCKEWIDPVSGDTPVFVTRLDLHVGLANSAALRAAGICADTPDPCGGEIFRDSTTGEPTGILKDQAIRLLESVLPKPSREEKEDSLRLALHLAASQGVTSVQDVTDWGNSAWTELALFEDFRNRGELTCRIYARLPLVDWDRRRADIPSFQTGPGADPWLRFGGLKGFVDGSLGARTASFFEPYADAPGYRGLLTDEMCAEGEMERRIREADLAGIPVSVHAIGDRANALLLEIFERVASSNGPRDRRLRVEHAQHLRPQDISRMAALGITVSVQPAQILDDGPWVERRLGADRCLMSYAFQSLAQSGVCLASGSDWPVSPLAPLLGIHAAVNRCTADGGFPGGWQPQEKLSLTQALETFTINAARAEFSESEKGSLCPGKFADLVVLSDDPYAVNPESIKDIQVLMTIVGGAVVYQRD